MTQPVPPAAFERRERNGNPPLDAARDRAVEEVIQCLLTVPVNPIGEFMQWG